MTTTCRTCQAPRRFRAHTNHVLHLLLTVFTCGLWLIVWLVIGMFAPPRCEVCGVPQRPKGGWENIIRRDT